MKIYVLFGFGIALCVAGVAYLAAEYIQYLSDIWKLASLMLTVAMFASLGKFFQEKGW